MQHRIIEVRWLHDLREGNFLYINLWSLYVKWGNPTGRTRGKLPVVTYIYVKCWGRVILFKTSYLFLGIGQNIFPRSSIVYVKLSYSTIRGPQVTSADVQNKCKEQIMRYLDNVV